MKTTNNNKKTSKPISHEHFFDRLWEESWTYIKTVVDVVREPVLILDKDFRVLVANEAFYQMFQVELKDTENKIVYDLGDGQWDIPALRRLLEGILPKNTFFKGFEVTHDFPFIGRKIMLLNARQIHFEKETAAAERFPSIILLAIEDITGMMAIAETISGHSQQLESKLGEQTHKLEIHIVKLEKEIDRLNKARK